MFALTGATGHLGQTLLRQLRSSGDPASVIVRPQSQKNLLNGYCSRIHEAGLDDVENMAKAFEGCNAVIHAAALIDTRRGQLKSMHQVNVEGTRNVMQACRLAGVKRLVYISSIEAFDLRAKRRPIRENFGFSTGDSVMDYGDTKAEASRMVAAAGLNGELDTILICPTTIIGPWDFRNGYFTTMTKKFLNRRIPAGTSGGMDFVDVRDVAGAVLAATRKGRSGEAYLVSGEYLSISQLFGLLETISTVRAPRLQIPNWLAIVGSETSELWSRTSGRQVLFTRGSIDILQKNVMVDSSKATEELGYMARPIIETLSDLVMWIQEGAAVNPDPLFA